MRVLGIDPGFGRLGVAVIEGNGRHQTVLMHNCIETSSKQEFKDRLLVLYDAVLKIIDEYKPDCVGLEKIFFFKNQKTVMDVAHVRGMLIALIGKRNITIKEFTPLQVKQTFVGYGRADKKQIKKMVRLVFKLTLTSRLDDISDALAIAWCALQTRSNNKPDPAL